MKNWKRWGEFIIVIVASLVVLFGSVLSWDWLVYGKNSDILRNVALTIGGIWAAYAVFLAAIRVKIMQQQQVSESLAKAAEQLSSEIMSVRILAILSLEKIAVEAQDEIRQDVVKVLCAYVRENRPIGQEDTQSANAKSPMPGDIQEILNVLSGIKTKTDWKIVMDLSNTNLSGAHLWNANLSGVNLRRVDLSDATLRSANLSGTVLLYANFRFAILEFPDLSGANLFGADLESANLSYVRGLDTAKNLDAVKNPPQEIIDEIARRKQEGQK